MPVVGVEVTFHLPARLSNDTAGVAAAVVALVDAVVDAESVSVPAAAPLSFFAHAARRGSEIIIQVLSASVACFIGTPYFDVRRLPSLGSSRAVRTYGHSLPQATLSFLAGGTLCLRFVRRACMNVVDGVV